MKDSLSETSSMAKENLSLLMVTHREGNLTLDVSKMAASMVKVL